MAWVPITRTPIQYEKTDGNPANGYYLKFYLGGTTTPTVMATDATGATQIAKCKLNEMGFPISNASDETSIFIPHVNSSFSSFRYVIYLNSADADANNLASAIVNFPSITNVFDVNIIQDISDRIDALSASDISTQSRFTGATQRTQQRRNNDTVSAFDFLTTAQADAVEAGTSTEDLSIQVQRAVNTQKAVYLPGGTWKFNLDINNKTIIHGDGSTKTIVKPYDNAKAAMRYTFTAQQNPIYRFWDYHSEIRNIGFFSNIAYTGVGFTFGRTVPSDWVANDEYANNVRFYGCTFEGLEKGVQFPFGNIGTEFYSCGLKNNKYAIYSIDSRYPVGATNTMHAGNKYFFGGEISSNKCAIYVHNQVTDGFGGLQFHGTIIESNDIGMYLYIAPRYLVPINLIGAWFENNGYVRGGTTTIDSWAAEVRSDQTLANRTIIIDGPNNDSTCRVNISSGICTDIWLKAPNTHVVATDCRVETQSGFGGGPFTVDYPDTSWVKLENPYSDGGWYTGPGSFMPYVSGMVHAEGGITNGGSRATGRVINAPPRSSKIANYGPSRVMSASLTTAANTGNGSFNLTGTVVSDGRIYASCNEFSRLAFTSLEYTSLSSPASSVTTSAGWYVVTLDIKVVSGAGVTVNVWNRSTSQLMSGAVVPETGKWYTFAAVAKATGGETIYLDFGGRNGDVVWRVSAYQMHKFSTEMEAYQFLESHAFAES
jgi:hypothetical protein